MKCFVRNSEEIYFVFPVLFGLYFLTSLGRQARVTHQALRKWRGSFCQAWSRRAIWLG